MKPKIKNVTLPSLFVCLTMICSMPCRAEESKPEYQPESKSLQNHPLPRWYDDAKLGIFIHWGIYSVPAWAPTKIRLHDAPMGSFFRMNPYAEWYLNSMRMDGSPTREHHLETYGEDFDYYDFALEFNEGIGTWDPQQMARLFKQAHARYVVLTTKHHDGFVLWPSLHRNPYLPFNKQQAGRDIVGELAAAVRGQGMRMGLYYSGGIDWSFNPVVIDGSVHSRTVTPAGEPYARYADAQWRELIRRYQPAVLWNDIGYPKGGEPLKIFAEYYNLHPEGVVNDRWGVEVYDYTTPEYAQYEEITPKKWESCRGIDYSFGYNRNSSERQMLSTDELVDMFVDIVSKNGNLLLNVGPKADGSIPELQRDRLLGLGRWLDVNGEAIFGTRPWLEAEAELEGGTVETRFTHKAGALFVILLDAPRMRTITIQRLKPVQNTVVHLLGQASPLSWSETTDGMTVTLPGELPQSPAHALKISPEPWFLAGKGAGRDGAPD